MPFLNDRVYDNGLTVLDTEADKVYITSAEATTYTQAITTYALGNKSLAAGDVTLADNSPSGRKAVVGALTGGSVTANGTATHWAIVDSVNSRLLAANALSASQSVTNGNTFNLPSFTAGSTTDATSL